ncbi:MAG: hypothetical protein HQ472_05025 [Ignavibacteria bacterium]|nr:hypothetical protein [Ignavibacteria bacterium]
MKNSRHFFSLTMAFVALTFLFGCVSYTRTERDVHTHTTIDTVVSETVKNQPGDRDNGIIYPSSRTVVINRSVVQYDSVAIREYPNFIRLGLFEGIGLMGTDLGGGSTQTGLFGVFYELDRILTQEPAPANTGALFSGYIYRFGIAEWRLRWLGDAHDWSVGITGYEVIRPDNADGYTLTGAGVLSVHKRFYLSNKIPYLCIRPQFSLSFVPSPYVNTSVSADLGSIGGLNLRVYAGYALGVTKLVDGNSVNFPYIGIGTSVLDFLNREEELETEWKNHEHSAWHVEVTDFALIGANTNFSIFTTNDPSKPQPLLSGIAGRVASAEVALPILDKRFAVGTSLLNVLIMGMQEFGIGVLPIRVSYFWNPFGNRFTVQPFLEYNYAPSNFIHTGFRALMPIADNTTLQIVAGYASGNVGSATARVFGDKIGVQGIDSFQAIYVGVGLSLFDRIFGSNELRYGRGLPHE